MWLWHAIEENEHKAVAFDVYKQTVDDEWLRLSEMAMVTVLFLGFTAVDLVRLLQTRGLASSPRLWLKAVNEMWGVPGHFRKLIPSYLAFYRRDIVRVLTTDRSAILPMTVSVLASLPRCRCRVVRRLGFKVAGDRRSG